MSDFLNEPVLILAILVVDPVSVTFAVTNKIDEPLILKAFQSLLITVIKNYKRRKLIPFVEFSYVKGDGCMDWKVVVLIPVITAIITLGFNVLFQLFQNNRNWFTDKKKFKREHNYNQLKELYLPIYGIVVQSEYVRYFFKKYGKGDFSVKEYPFLEIHNTKSNIKNGVLTKEELQNAITEFNKKEVATKIITKCEFASQKLLKLAVAYRYTEANYLNSFDDEEILNNFQKEEFELIYLIVKTIIKECNELLEESHLPFDTKEKSTGMMTYDVFEESE